MSKTLTAVLALTLPAVMLLFAAPVVAQLGPGKPLPPKAKMTGPPPSPAQQAEADKLAKERLEIQLKQSAERKKAEKAREEELKKARGVVKVPEKTTSKQPSPVKK